MAYDRALIVSRVLARLGDQPSMSLSDISREFALDRHTIARAVKASTGLTFRDLQGQCLVTVARRLQLAGIISKKELAVRLGYSSARVAGRRLKKVLGAPTSLRPNQP